MTSMGSATAVSTTQPGAAHRPSSAAGGRAGYLVPQKCGFGCERLVLAPPSAGPSPRAPAPPGERREWAHTPLTVHLLHGLPWAAPSYQFAYLSLSQP